ncbi:MAG: hypothetical protein AAGC93_17600 [Cyanobacteria bacterium P01_F01_bin.53]
MYDEQGRQGKNKTKQARRACSDGIGQCVVYALPVQIEIWCSAGLVMRQQRLNLKEC